MLKLIIRKPGAIDRRTLITTAAGLVGGTLLSFRRARPAAARQIATSADSSQTIIRASSSVANAETTAGKIRGFIRNDIYTFKGIPYGASTAGEGRFLAPSKPVPWTGVRTTMQYGCVCPQEKRDNWKHDEMAFLMDWDDGHPGEDCLRLNIWTPSTRDGRKRPVMVWLHGGAYRVGSGHELKSYDGENLSRRGDVVVISLNHRLGLLGYLDLSELGDDRFADSINVGMLDIVRALEWVHDNVASFGGDPDNVTVFGESSGGCEVSTLMAMPRAQGLFHRAVVQSGSALNHIRKEQAVQTRDAVLKELGLKQSNLARIQTLPPEQIVAATSTGLPFGPRPWVDGHVIPSNPFNPAAPAISAQVPMLIGRVMNEYWPIGDPDSQALYDDAEKRATMAYGDKAAVIIEMARRLHPQAKPFEISTLIDVPNVALAKDAVTQAQRKVALGAAPAYMYLFGWHSPELDGRTLAFHQSEIPFVFDNTDRCASVTGGGPESRALAAKVSDAWINFARNGNPSHSGLPDWPAFKNDSGATMVFDSYCHVQRYPDRELHDLIVATLSAQRTAH